MPPAARNLFIKRFLDFQKFFIKALRDYFFYYVRYDILTKKILSKYLTNIFLSSTMIKEFFQTSSIDPSFSQ
jgi:hypothetical protein